MNNTHWDSCLICVDFSRCTIWCPSRDFHIVASIVGVQPPYSRYHLELRIPASRILADYIQTWTF